MESEKLFQSHVSELEALVRQRTEQVKQLNSDNKVQFHCQLSVATFI